MNHMNETNTAPASAGSFYDIEKEHEIHTNVYTGKLLPAEIRIRVVRRSVTGHPVSVDKVLTTGGISCKSFVCIEIATSRHTI